MKKIIGFALIAIATSTALMASTVPEIDVNMGGSALSLVGGALLVIGSRRKKK